LVQFRRLAYAVYLGKYIGYDTNRASATVAALAGETKKKTLFRMVDFRIIGVNFLKRGSYSGSLSLTRRPGVAGQSIPRPDYTRGIIWSRVRVSVMVRVSVGRPDYTRG